MTLHFRHLILLLFIVIVCSTCRKSDYVTRNGSTVIRDNGSGTGNVTWTSDKDYYLDGLVFVNDGQTLTIEAGTVIRAKTGQGKNASALIVSRGGKIMAEGTAEKPIIFTVEGDDLEGSVPLLSKGLWGGVIILGNARINNSAGEALIEGISITEPRGIYGGNDDNDNSGILRYLSIRHGGTNIGEGNEINGLTLGAVGSATIIDFVEIISNRDDGIECFGGTVNLKHIVVAFCGDDSFDFDDGYRGRGQFWLSIQDPDEGDYISEHDGGTDPINGTPYSIPEIHNVTFIGRGSDISNHLILFKDNAGGTYANSIFINQGQGIIIEYNTTGQHSFQHFLNNDLVISNNIFYNVAENIQENILNAVNFQNLDIENQDSILNEYFLSAENIIYDPGIEFENEMYLVIPMNNVNTSNAAYSDSWFDNVEYKGAFGHYNWANGWTLLSQSKIIE